MREEESMNQTLNNPSLHSTATFCFAIWFTLAEIQILLVYSSSFTCNTGFSGPAGARSCPLYSSPPCTTVFPPSTLWQNHLWGHDIHQMMFIDSLPIVLAQLIGNMFWGYETDSFDWPGTCFHYLHEIAACTEDVHFYCHIPFLMT